MWLASISRFRQNGQIVYVPEWSPSQLREAERRLRQMVEGVGNDKRERLFRMNVTLCLHRAATDAEVTSQPPWFLSAPGNGLAGGPVEVLSETEAGDPSTKPCHDPKRYLIDGFNPHAWIPLDCGHCEPCRARIAA